MVTLLCLTANPDHLDHFPPGTIVDLVGKVKLQAVTVLELTFFMALLLCELDAMVFVEPLPWSS